MKSSNTLLAVCKAIVFSSTSCFLHHVFHKDFVSVSDNFIALYGTWIPTKSKVLMIVIYAPQSPALKRVLWDYISSLISRWNGETVIMGDFNEVRSVDERLGSTFNHSSARVFNNFISSSGLVEVKMEGSFDVIIGMDWLAYHRALIDCYKKIVRIPLPNGKILEVQGERP
ncbi:RNA-directed DNA polymerase, eukaryota, partial [Tanacetum coccineum]